MKQRITRKTNWLLLLMMLMWTSTVKGDELVDGIYYKLNQISDSRSTATVTRGPLNSSTRTYRKYSGNIKIPSKITVSGRDYVVTIIATSAFSDCDGLTSVLLPNTINTIMQDAFARCTQIKSLTLPDSLTIYDRGFIGCSNLKSITFLGSEIELRDKIFYGCDSIESITFNGTTVNSCLVSKRA